MANLLKVEIDGRIERVRMEDIRRDRGLFALKGADFIWRLTESPAVVLYCERDWQSGLVTLGDKIQHNDGTGTTDYSTECYEQECRRQEREAEQRHREWLYSR